MNKAFVIILVLLGMGLCGWTGSAIQRNLDVRIVEQWQGVVRHYEFHIARLYHENLKLWEACENLTIERDIYYLKMHEALNEKRY